MGDMGAGLGLVAEVADMASRGDGVFVNPRRWILFAAGWKKSEEQRAKRYR